MTVKTILLHVAAETCDPTRRAAAYALGLARAFEAYLEALVLELDVVMPRRRRHTRISTAFCQPRIPARER